MNGLIILMTSCLMWSGRVVHLWVRFASSRGVIALDCTTGAQRSGDIVVFGTFSGDSSGPLGASECIFKADIVSAFFIGYYQQRQAQVHLNETLLSTFPSLPSLGRPSDNKVPVSWDRRIPLFGLSHVLMHRRWQRLVTNGPRPNKCCARR